MASPARFSIRAIALAGLLNLVFDAASAQTTVVACEVAGYDVIIRNPGSEPIAAGTKVDWSVPFARKDGKHSLDAPLQPGETIFLSQALGSTFLSAKRACEASIGQG
jgi:hypothetical protein